MSTIECVKLIESHNIDILVDLAGYTKNARTEIFLYKPAPILINYQLSWKQWVQNIMITLFLITPQLVM